MNPVSEVKPNAKLENKESPRIDFKPEPIPELEANPEVKSNTIDYDRLFHAVSMAESGGCKSAVAVKTNNCVSIMQWKNGKRSVRKFASIDENKAAFIELWQRVYKRLPDVALAKKYTGNDKPHTWLKAVNQHYYN